jgi:hypothetical protein
MKDRRFLTSFIDSCDTTAPSREINVQAGIEAFFRGEMSTYDCAFIVAEYLQYTRGNGKMDLFNTEGIFELLAPMELATFIGELQWTLAVDGIKLDITLVNFAERVGMHADVSLEDYTEAIDMLVMSL